MTPGVKEELVTSLASGLVANAHGFLRMSRYFLEYKRLMREEYFPPFSHPLTSYLLLLYLCSLEDISHAFVRKEGGGEWVEAQLNGIAFGMLTLSCLPGFYSVKSERVSGVVFILD
jgi:hypothetical protein